MGQNIACQHNWVSIREENILSSHISKLHNMLVLALKWWLEGGSDKVVHPGSPLSRKWSMEVGNLQSHDNQLCGITVHYTLKEWFNYQ